MAGSLSYEVDYKGLDSFKRECQARAAQTYRNALRLGFTEERWSRGESCYVIRGAIDRDVDFGHVEEGLGTKNLVADAVAKYSEKSLYHWIGQCNAAMVFNDLASQGISPVSFALHIAVANADWFNDAKRARALIEGTGTACDTARCVWGGGETPGLKGIIERNAALLSGSAWGIAKKGRAINPERIEPSDVIIMLESSGPHANGYTLFRSIGDRRNVWWRNILTFINEQKWPKALPYGYDTVVDGVHSYGRHLLEPTHIYSDFVEDCQDAGVDIHSAINITGHGWRKLMRANKHLDYIIENMPLSQPIFEFIQKHGPVTDHEAYGNFNMGAGFALIVPQQDVKKVLKLTDRYCLEARYRGWVAGRVERPATRTKRVVIVPMNLEYYGEELAIRN